MSTFSIPSLRIIVIISSPLIQVCKVARALDPSFAAQYLAPHHCDELVSTIAPLMDHIDPMVLKAELPSYLAAAQNNVHIARDDVDSFTNGVLLFWRNSSFEKLNEWRKAARIVFSMSPNSASCERVFSLLACMYGEQQDSVLADHLQASLMLRYNKRAVFDV